MRLVKISIALLVTLLLLVGPAQAATTIAPITPLKNEVFAADKDILVMEFTLDPQEAADTLQSISFQQSGNSLFTREYVAFNLYADYGIAGFQGWGYDTLVGTAAPDGSLMTFANINHTFDTPTKFYMTIDIGIVPLGRIFSGSIFNLELASQTFNSPSGMTAAIIEIIAAQNDGKAPQAFLENVDFGTTETKVLAPGEEFVFLGQARDLGRNQVSYVTVVVGDTEIAALSTENSYTKWQATYAPTDPYEEVAISLKSADSLNLKSTSPLYHVIFDSRVIDGAQSTLSTDQSFIKADGLQMANLSLVMVDGSGTPLPGRVLTFSSTGAGDIISVSQVTTDVDGRATFSVSSTSAGTSTIQVLYSGAVVKSLPINFTADVVNIVPADPSLKLGDLVKGSMAAVYYLDQNGKRHSFINDKVYASWYGLDFSKVKTITDGVLASIPLGAPVTFRPGVMLTSPSVNEVYIVDVNRTLRHIGSEQVAKDIFGSSWNTMITDLQESLLFSYNFGDVINSASEFNLSEIENLSLTINNEIVS